MENTKIEWATHTFNPWIGCTKVSPGCAHCYAEGWAKRSGQVAWGPGQPRRRTKSGGESGPGARPMHPAWARRLRDQCTAANVPFHF